MGMDFSVEEVLDLISPLYLWMGFVVFAFIFAMFTLAINYHWKHYTIDRERSKRIMRVYYVISSVILGVMFLSIILFSA